MQSSGNSESVYGNLLQIQPGRHGKTEVLRRVPLVPLGSETRAGGIEENRLRDYLFQYPQCLPIHDIDADYDGAIPVCKELQLRTGTGGRIDALYVNPQGRLTLAEFKLWRNPQSYREVVAQILDYAKDLAALSYEDLQQAVSRQRGGTGNVLYELALQQEPELREQDFVDNVTHYLQLGEFLLLIVGDGIRKNLQEMVAYNHSLHQRYKLALVEVAIYRDQEKWRFVQPRILAKTEVVERDYANLPPLREKLEAIDDKLENLTALAGDKDDPDTPNDNPYLLPAYFAQEKGFELVVFDTLDEANTWVEAAAGRTLFSEDRVVQALGQDRVDALKTWRRAEREYRRLLRRRQEGA